MYDFDDTDLAIIGIIIIFLTSLIAFTEIALNRPDLTLKLVDKFAAVWFSLGAALAGITRGKNRNS